MYNIKLNGDIAVVECDEIIFATAQSCLDFIATIGYEYGVSKIVINKSAITDGFFNLSTGIAGEIAQKFVNYGFRLAIIGNFSKYTSKPLLDYMYECNSGRTLYFVSDLETAIQKLKG